MSAYPEVNLFNGIWKYRNKRFETKIERDSYQRGYEDALRECERRRREFHIREER